MSDVAITTLVLAATTFVLAVVAFLELRESRAQRRAADEARERDARRTRAMKLLTVIVRCLDILRSFETEVARSEGLQHGIVGSMFDAGAAKWGRFDEDWRGTRPELTTWLYVCDFVLDDLRLTIGERFDVVATEASSRSEPRTLQAVKNLEASLGQVLELIDRELGLKASRRPL